MKRGLALEGGGARGAYHIGAFKALTEMGFTFDGFTGTSIGAINAAMLAQGDFKKALELWENISLEQIFDAHEQGILLRLTDTKGFKFESEILHEIMESFSKLIRAKGVSTEKMLDFLNRYIDEDKLRKSGKDFGLVTVSLSERKPYELMLADIPEGKLVDYIMASASFPGFRSQIIDGKKYIDGAFYNNVPVDLLNDLGYDEIIAVRIHGPGLIHGNIAKMENVRVISAARDLGNIMLFTAENSAENLKLGYEDGLGFVTSPHKTPQKSYPAHRPRPARL